MRLDFKAIKLKKITKLRNTLTAPEALFSKIPNLTPERRPNDTHFTENETKALRRQLTHLSHSANGYPI